MLCDRAASGLIVVDLQDSFLAPIPDRENVVQRSRFLIEIARLLSVPVIATEQYATRMGGTTEPIRKVLGDAPSLDKMCFSSCRNEGFWSAWEALGRSQAVLVGIETHICVNQTAQDLLERGYEVFVCEDATGARMDAREGALKRLRHEGAVVTHTESVAYEWLVEAGTPQFKAALELVKRYN
ncbi:MAG: isochorismatase family protein [Armatimonadota bacterium]|nr:isochorismatase family protein [Armatimonadota bacterium]